MSLAVSLSRTSQTNGTELESYASSDSNETSTSQAGVARKSPTHRTTRPSRACAGRATQKTHDGQPSPLKEKPCLSNNAVTPLVEQPEVSQLPRWSLRSMWELASILNFLHVFRPLLNIHAEFSAEEFETALIMPNDTLGDIHIPLLKAVPPVTRVSLTKDTWVTVLCRKIKDWWHLVADGEIPIVASHGVETDVYKTLDPKMRVAILKALCEVRVEQEDIRNHIDNSLKQGVQISMFRKERIGGDSQGIHYWYEDDPVIGHRLYREMRKTEADKKIRGSMGIPCETCTWETVATNYEEFHDVSEKLILSRNKTEVLLGKKLKADLLSEIEKVQKKKERLLKKQHREALLLDNFIGTDGLVPGRSLRCRKPVTYTFDDFDQSINEAIKMTKRKSPDQAVQAKDGRKTEVSANGKMSERSHSPDPNDSNAPSPDSDYVENREGDEDDTDESPDSKPFDRRDRHKRRSHRYSGGEFVEVASDDDLHSNGDEDEEQGEIYDNENDRKRKRIKPSSSTELDDEDSWDEEEDESGDASMSSVDNESGDEGKTVAKNLPLRTRRETRHRSVNEIQSGLRRSKRATKNRVNYRKYELSESESESAAPTKSHDPESGDGDESSPRSQCPNESNKDDEVADNGREESEVQTHQRPEEPKKQHLLDLNELAPDSGFDDELNFKGKG